MAFGLQHVAIWEQKFNAGAPWLKVHGNDSLALYTNEMVVGAVMTWDGAPLQLPTFVRTGGDVPGYVPTLQWMPNTYLANQAGGFINIGFFYAVASSLVGLQIVPPVINSGLSGEGMLWWGKVFEQDLAAPISSGNSFVDSIAGNQTFNITTGNGTPNQGDLVICLAAIENSVATPTVSVNMASPAGGARTFSWPTLLPGNQDATTQLPYVLEVRYVPTTAPMTLSATIADNNIVNHIAAIATIKAMPPSPPIFIRQPVMSTVDRGSTGFFDVQVTSNAGFESYQWRRNGVDIPGASSSSLFLTANDTNANKRYDCRVSNTAGAAYSAAAWLITDPGVSDGDGRKLSTAWLGK